MRETGTWDADPVRRTMPPTLHQENESNEPVFNMGQLSSVQMTVQDSEPTRIISQEESSAQLPIQSEGDCLKCGVSPPMYMC